MLIFSNKLKMYLKILRFFTYSFYDKFSLICSCLSGFVLNIQGIKTKKQKTALFFNRKKKLRKVSGFIGIRVFKLQLENIIFFVCGRFLDIVINPVFIVKGLTITTYLGSRIEKQGFRFVFYLLLLSTQYNESKLISNYLTDILKTTKKHYQVLKDFVSMLEFFFFNKTIQFRGLQIRATGKLGGKMRRSKYHYKLGKVCLQTLKIGLSYSLSISYTRFGIISIKV